MGWPKGVPRKGHINKNGTPHAARGSLMDKTAIADKKITRARAPRRARRVEPEVVVTEPSKRWNRKWNVPFSHPTYRLVADQCPNCEFPEADGGYCPNCGWSAPYVLHPRDSLRGKPFGGSR